MSESVDQEFSLATLENALLTEVNGLDNSPQTAILKIAQKQIFLVRSGITDPMLVLRRYDDLFLIAEEIRDLRGDNYNVAHKCLCEAIVNYSEALRLQLYFIEKKTTDALKEECRQLLRSSIYAGGTIIAKAGSPALKAAAGIFANSKKTAAIGKAIEEVDEQFLHEVAASTSIEKCKKEIETALNKAVDAASHFLEKENARRDFYDTLAALTDKLNNKTNVIDRDSRIAGMIRNYSVWMTGYEMGKDSFWGILNINRPPENSAYREGVAKKYDRVIDKSWNPILLPEAKDVCTSLKSKLEIYGGPLAELCGVGVDLLSKTMPDTTCTMEYMKKVCGIVSQFGDSEAGIVEVSAKTLGNLSKILIDQIKERQPAEGVHSRVSEIGLRITRDCMKLMGEDDDGKELRQLASEIQFYSTEERPRKIREFEASDSYQAGEIDADELFALFGLLGSIASKVGPQSELADIVLPIAKEIYDEECLEAQKTFDSECQKAEETFKQECRSKDVSEEKVSALKTKMFVTAGLVLGSIVVIANMDAGFIKVIGYIVLVCSGCSFIAALFGAGTISTWNRLVEEKNAAMTAAEGSKSESLSAAKAELDKYQSIARNLKSASQQAPKMGPKMTKRVTLASRRT